MWARGWYSRLGEASATGSSRCSDGSKAARWGRAACVGTFVLHTTPLRELLGKSCKLARLARPAGHGPSHGFGSSGQLAGHIVCKCHRKGTSLLRSHRQTHFSALDCTEPNLSTCYARIDCVICTRVLRGPLRRRPRSRTGHIRASRNRQARLPLVHVSVVQQTAVQPPVAHLKP